MEKKDVIRYVQGKLFELQDLNYRDFHAKLMPTVYKERVIGSGASGVIIKLPLSNL